MSDSVDGYVNSITADSSACVCVRTRIRRHTYTDEEIFSGRVTMAVIITVVAVAAMILFMMVMMVWLLIVCSLSMEV